MKLSANQEKAINAKLPSTSVYSFFCVWSISSKLHCMSLNPTYLLWPSTRSALSAPAVLAASPFNWLKLLSGRKHVPQFLREFEPEQQLMGPGPVAGSAGGVPGLSAAERSLNVQKQVAGVVGRVLGSGELKCY
jgi:hypothetical protein